MSSSDRIEKFNGIADSLIQQQHTGTSTDYKLCTKVIPSYLDLTQIVKLKEKVNNEWTQLRKLIETRSKVLAIATRIHTFTRDVNDILQQIQVSS